MDGWIDGWTVLNFLSQEEDRHRYTRPPIAHLPSVSSSNRYFLPQGLTLQYAVKQFLSLKERMTYINSGKSFIVSSCKRNRRKQITDLPSRGNSRSIRRLMHAISDRSRSIKRRGYNVGEMGGDGHRIMHKRAARDLGRLARLLSYCSSPSLSIGEGWIKNSFDNNAP